MRSLKWIVMLAAGLAGWLPAGAVERTLTIEAPATIVEGEPLFVAITASTDAGKGEQVGFLQAEVSQDGGKTWQPVCYLEASGPKVTQPARFRPFGKTVLLRARAAFRDGPAGDVDFAGKPIQWDATWKDWKSPPAKYANVAVIAR